MDILYKWLLLMVGVLCLGLGLIGIFMPILPTTPFLLLASFCFAKGSHTINKWFKNKKIYRDYVVRYKETGMTKKDKIRILGISCACMGVSGIIVDNGYVRLFLFTLAMIQLIVFVKL